MNKGLKDKTYVYITATFTYSTYIKLSYFK